ncbi:DUF732 domain-containing protein [Mycobacterium ulcerans]|uniref:DUF732 domain-containing protein n=1 Tax=Mycobacterium ulcerans subsp. shinshuense TaxID=1124626 RepID=A0A1B4Y079_MYCUL|nr:DUF732 domain-containing protein [Mycobacterium ulcerans]BAV40466.1 hypothetical protein SHTP_1175 [Mycobacterium ulcerans subsp. shinshuense]
MRAWRYQPLTVRLLAGAAGLLTASAALAAPAEADSVDDVFINALNAAGVNYGDAGGAEALGRSVCPVLSEPGGSFNSAASKVVAGGSGMSPEMAATFTSIAISMYCPSVMANVTSGNLPLQGIPGVPAIPSVPGVPGF